MNRRIFADTTSFDCEDDAVRFMLASSTDTPVRILTRLANDPVANVRFAVYNNPSTPENIRENIWDFGPYTEYKLYFDVDYSAVGAPNLSEIERVISMALLDNLVVYCDYYSEDDLIMQYTMNTENMMCLVVICRILVDDELDVPDAQQIIYEALLHAGYEVRAMISESDE